MSYLEDPRVFFAAERTLLAWQRTSIALMGLGLLSGAGPAIGHRRMALVFTVSFLLVAAVAALISTFQYQRFLRELSAPEIPRGHLRWPGPVLNTLLAAAAVVMAFWFVFSR